MVQTFDFTEPYLTKRLRFEDGDWDVGRRAKLAAHEGEGVIDIIDLDGNIRRIVYPGNASDHGKRNPGVCVRESVILTWYRNSGHDGGQYSNLRLCLQTYHKRDMSSPDQKTKSRREELMNGNNYLPETENQKQGANEAQFGSEHQCVPMVQINPECTASTSQYSSYPPSRRLRRMKCVCKVEQAITKHSVLYLRSCQAHSSSCARDSPISISQLYASLVVACSLAPWGTAFGLTHPSWTPVWTHRVYL